MRLLSIICFAATLAASGLLRAEDLCIQVNAASGDYTIAATDPAWRFGGSLGAPVSNVTTNPGHDGIGSYRETAFEWKEATNRWAEKSAYMKDNPWRSSCKPAGRPRPLRRPRFRPSPACRNRCTSSASATTNLPRPICRQSKSPRPGCCLTARPTPFSFRPPRISWWQAWLATGGARSASGFNPQLRDLPAGFTQQTLVAFGKGINKTWESLGPRPAGIAGRQAARQRRGHGPEISRLLD